MRIKTTLSLVSLAFALQQTDLLADIVINGSFETPLAPSGSYVTTIPDGWSALGNGSTVEVISTGYGGSVASDGSQFIDLVGGGVGTFPSGVLQRISLVGGISYRLSFDYNGGRYSDGSPTSGAALDWSLGSIVSGLINVDALNAFAANGPVTPWARLESNFTAPTTGEYILKFQTSSGAFGSPYVDNVSVAPLSAPDSGSTFTLIGLAMVSACGTGLFTCGRTSKNRT